MKRAIWWTLIFTAGVAAGVFLTPPTRRAARAVRQTVEGTTCEWASWAPERECYSIKRPFSDQWEYKCGPSQPIFSCKIPIPSIDMDGR